MLHKQESEHQIKLHQVKDEGERTIKMLQKEIESLTDQVNQQERYIGLLQSKVSYKHFLVS